jgi:hypothetical protein
MSVMRAALLVIAFVVALGRSTASAVTPQEIVALSKAGVSDQVILALIERDQTVFAIAPDQLAELKNDGVSEQVVVAMLRSSRQPPPQEPIVVLVGSDPDRPNSTGLHSNRVAAAQDAAPYFVPYAVGIPYLVPPYAERSRCMARGAVRPSPPTGTIGIFFATPFRGQFFGPPGPESVGISLPTSPGTAGRSLGLQSCPARR